MNNNLKFWPFIVLLALVACTSNQVTAGQGSFSTKNLEATVAAQATRISYLSTRDIRRDQEATLVALTTRQSYLATAVAAQGPSQTGGLTPTAYTPPITSITSTPTLAQAVTVYPPGVRTGVGEIDRIIDAAFNESIDARREFIRYTRTACTTADGLGGPPKCEPGEIEGTLVDAFPLSESEGHYARPETIDSALTFTVRGLYAVYRVLDDAYERDYWPAGQYGLVFTLDESRHSTAIAVIVEDGRIVRLDYYVGEPLIDALERRGGDYILPPLVCSGGG